MIITTPSSSESSIVGSLRAGSHLGAHARRDTVKRSLVTRHAGYIVDVFEFLWFQERFRNGSVWTVDQSVERKLRFQISSVWSVHVVGAF